MSDYTPVFAAGAPITLQASATIVGGNLLEVTGVGTVGPAAAASVKYAGVAAHDAATGAKVAVYATPGDVHENTSAGAITAGQQIACGAAGAAVVLQATPADGQDVGVALTTAVGNVVRWKAYR